MVALLVTGVVMAFAVASGGAWLRASEHAGTAQAIESTLRQVQQRAVTEGTSMCVDFDTAAGTWTLWRGRCDSPTRTRLVSLGETADRVHLAEATFSYPGGTDDAVTFSPRGTATPGTVKVTRDGHGQVHTVTVEGLTGRVSKN